MIALDTNVLVRVITRDDRAQARAAAAILRDADFLLTKTVLTEVVWVLTGAYDLDRGIVVSALRTLLGIENGVCEDRMVVLQAIAWFEEGLDFSDAVHLASARDAAVFATFDQRFAKTAARLSVTPTVRLLRGDEPGLVRESPTRRHEPRQKVSRARARAKAR